VLTIPLLVTSLTADSFARHWRPFEHRMSKSGSMNTWDLPAEEKASGVDCGPFQ